MHDVRSFDRFARPFDRLTPPADPETFAPAFELAEGSLDRVLDVGGGSGRGGRAVVGENAIVVDAAPGMVREARHRGHEAVLGDACRLPVRSGAVDAVVVLDALHHFPDPRAAVREAGRALRPGGVFVVRDFDPTTLRGRALAFAEHAVGFDSTFLDPGELAAACTNAGLEPRVTDAGFAYTLGAVRAEPRA